jgi:hypothetical protein
MAIDVTLEEFGPIMNPEVATTTKDKTFLRDENHGGFQIRPSSTCDGLKYLKVGITFLINLAVMLASTAYGAGTATLAWNPSTSPNVAGYYVYYGGASGTYTNKLFVGNANSVTINTLVAGKTYYFAMTSYTTAGTESMLSNEASYSVPVIVPVNAPVLGTPFFTKNRIAPHLDEFNIPVSGLIGSRCAVEVSSNLVTWVRAVTNTVPFTYIDSNASKFVKRFYRAVMLP